MKSSKDKTEKAHLSSAISLPSVCVIVKKYAQHIQKIKGVKSGRKDSSNKGHDMRSL